MKLQPNIYAPAEDELDFSSGGGVAALEPPAEPPGEPAAPATPATPAPSVPAAPAGPAPVQLTQEQLKELMQGVAPKQQPQAPAALSEDEQDKLLRRFRVNEDFVKQIFAVESTPAVRAKALQDLVDRTAEHAFHVATLKAQKEIALLREEFTKEFEPVRSHFTKQQEEAAVKQFYGKHPYLEPYKQVVTMVAGSLDKAALAKMKPDEIENAIVQSVLHNLKSLGLNVDPTQPAQPTTPPVPRSPALNGGGRSQGPALPAGGAPKKTADEAAWLDS